MKGWLQDVLMPTLEAALTASVPLSSLWLLYQASPKYSMQTDDAKAESARVREESTAAITATVLAVLGIAGTATYVARRWR